MKNRRFKLNVFLRSSFKKQFYALIYLTIILSFITCKSEKEIFDLKFEKKSSEIISKMTLDEKILQIRGMNLWDIPSIERLNIPKFKTIYGPFYGINEIVAVFPSPVALAAMWDTTLMRKIGNAYGAEVKAYGYNQWLGPCVNLHRLPIGGRNFESSSEDPFLTAEINVPLIKGIQEKGAIVALKHFALNNQEFYRNSVDMIGDERTLNELYLYAFKECVERAKPYGVMTSYNKINGTFGSENYELITNYLRKKWGFSGFVISDWYSTHASLKTFKSGLDIVMPDDVHYVQDTIKDLLSRKKITENEIDEKLKHFYTIRYKTGMNSEKKASEDNFVRENKVLTLEAARSSIVLLKNEKNILPINTNRVKTIAVIGPYSEYATTGGGGSSRMAPAYSVSLLNGISNVVGNNVKVLFAEGTLVDNGKPYKLNMDYFFTHDNCNENGFLAEFFPNNDFKGLPVLTKIIQNLDLNISSLFKKGELPDTFSVKISAFMKVPEKKWYEFFVTSDESFTSNLKNEYDAHIQEKGFMKRSIGQNIFETGKLYPVIFKFKKNDKLDKLKVEWSHPYDDGKDYITEAVNIAKKADIVLLTAGFSNYYEAEGLDRQREMPGNQNVLIQNILDVNPNTIVVLQSGTPIEINDWVAKAPAIIQNWYNGQESGNALAQVLFGQINPSGKLPFSWVKKYEDSPTMKEYGKDSSKTEFKEGIFMGYRYYDKNNLTVQFPFGHGLSYTKFDYSDIKIKKTGKKEYIISMHVKNTGDLEGKEIVQLYVGEKNPTVPRPLKELKGFLKINLKAGETKKVLFYLNKKSFAFYDITSNNWKINNGEYEIFIGSSSRDIRLKTTIKINTEGKN